MVLILGHSPELLSDYSPIPEGRRAQCVACQHHTLFGMLKKVLNQLSGGESRSPNNEYDFSEEIFGKI